MTIHQRFRRALAIEVYQTISGICPLLLNEDFGTPQRNNNLPQNKFLEGKSVESVGDIAVGSTTIETH